MFFSEFLTIAIAHLIAVASPGPDFAIVLRHSVSLGRRAGTWTSAGIALGILLHASYCLLGLGVLLSSSPRLFALLLALAGIYLVYLGVGAIRASLQGPVALQADGSGLGAGPGRWLLTGFLTNGLNPKVTLFFLALFTVVIDSDTPLAVQGLVGVYLSLATFCWFAMLTTLLGHERIRGAVLRSGVWFDRVMGLVLIGLGLRLALTLFAGV